MRHRPNDPPAEEDEDGNEDGNESRSTKILLAAILTAQQEAAEALQRIATAVEEIAANMGNER